MMDGVNVSVVILTYVSFAVICSCCLIVSETFGPHHVVASVQPHWEVWYFCSFIIMLSQCLGHTKM